MTDVRALSERVSQALTSLGDTPEAVVESLRRLGVKGRRCDGSRCVLACYLRKHVEGAQKAIVFPYHVVVFDEPEAAVPLPAACQEAARGYDLRRYMDMVEDGGD